MSASSDSVSSFFDTLPDDVLDIISARVLAHPFTKICDLLTTHNLKKSYGRGLACIKLSTDEKQIYVHRTKLYFGMRNRLGKFMNILTELNPKVRQVVLDCSESKNIDIDIARSYFREFAGLLVRYCPNVCEVFIHLQSLSDFMNDTVAALIRGYGNKLSTFTIHVREGKLMPFVPVLSSSCSSLKRFEFHGHSFSGVGLVLSALGDTLKAVELYIVGSEEEDETWIDMFDVMRLHCHRLESIALCFPLNDDEPVSDADFVSLLTSYGSQLKFASFSCLGVEGCAEIARACPNLRCSILDDGSEYERIANLGNRLQRLHLQHERHDEEENLEAMKNAFALCTNLASLQIDLHDHPGTMYDPWIPSVFANPLPSLEILVFTGATFLSPEKIDIIAEATSRLRKISLNLMSMEKIDSLRKLVDRNCNLEHVGVSVMTVPSLSSVKAMSQEAANMFSACKSLKTLILEFGIRQFGRFEKISMEEINLPAQFRFIDFKVSRTNELDV